MNYLLTAVFENGFCELYLPSVDNKKVPLEIKPYISGRDDDIILPVEVWDGVWTLSGQGNFVIMQDEKPVESVTLKEGLFVNCEFPDGQVFSLTAQAVTEGNTQFKKYLVKSDRITIGKDASNTISFGNKFVSPKHAEISISGGLCDHQGSRQHERNVCERTHDQRTAASFVRRHHIYHRS